MPELMQSTHCSMTMTKRREAMTEPMNRKERRAQAKKAPAAQILDQAEAQDQQAEQTVQVETKEAEAEAAEAAEAPQRPKKKLSKEEKAKAEQTMKQSKLAIAGMVHRLVYMASDYLVGQTPWPQEQFDLANENFVTMIDYYFGDDILNPAVLYALVMANVLTSNIDRERAVFFAPKRKQPRLQEVEKDPEPATPINSRGARGDGVSSSASANA